MIGSRQIRRYYVCQEPGMALWMGLQTVRRDFVSPDAPIAHDAPAAIEAILGEGRG